MYERFFGLRHRPFTLRPDPRFLFPSKTHSTALKMLEYGLFEQDGFVVITGDIGSGKTMLIRYLLDTLDNNFQVGLIANTHCSFGDLLGWVASSFGLEHDDRSESMVYEAFTKYLINGYANGKRTLLIIDEAQNLSPRSLEEVRVVSNINADGDHVLQLLLVGQPELRGILRQPGLEQFAQRISVHYHVEPLERQDVGRYINHRLQVAGANRPIFTDLALGRIAEATGGIPRLVNQISDTALFYAYAEQSYLVRGEVVEQVIVDRQNSRVLPLAIRGDSDAYTLSANGR